MRLVLKTSTLWEKEVAKRVRRGVKLLDSVTPNWFVPINPSTLKVSDREMCVFAQASHSFDRGIVQVALKALTEGKTVKLLKDPHRKYWWLPKNPEGKPTLDVFHYGFDVTWEDATKFKIGVGVWTKRGSRKKAFATIDAMWHDVVVQKKKAHELEKKAPGTRKRCPDLRPNAELKQVGDWVRR